MNPLFVVAVPACLAAAVALVRGPCPDRRLGSAVPTRRSSTAGGVSVRWTAALRPRPTSTAVVAGWTEAWAAAVRAGRPVGAALDDAFTDVVAARRLLPRTAVAGALGGDVAEAMRHDAREAPRAEGRAVLAAAACWSVARDNGGRLADALDRLGESLRAEALHAAHVRAQLAGPRATARLLAGLPVFALLLGMSMGLRPLSVLIGDPVGRAALLAGLLLDAAGLLWTEQLARAAERSA